MNVPPLTELNENSSWEMIQTALKRSTKQRLGAAWCKSELHLTWGQPAVIVAAVNQVCDRLLSCTDLANCETSADTANSIGSFADLAKQFSNETQGQQVSLASALEGLCLAYHINHFADDSNCSEIVNTALRDLQHDGPPTALSIPNTGPELLALQLSAIEYPLVILSQCFSDISQTRFQNVAIEITQRFESLLNATTDGDGWIESSYFQQFWQLTASWARTFLLLEHLDISVGEECRRQLEWVCRQFVRTMGPDGRQLLGPADQCVASIKFQEAMTNLSLDRADKKLLRLRDPNRESKKKDDINLTLFDESGFSEWASSGVFQSGWGDSSPRIAITAHQSRLELEIAAQTSLIRGLSESKVCFNGKPLGYFHQEHEICCWHCDDGVEYVEFEFQLEQGAKLERQILLCREDRFAIIADAVRFADSGEVEFEMRLPLSNGISVLPETETREVYLKDDQIRALALPLALGEWKADGMGGSLGFDDGDLVLKQSCRGRAIYAPLFIDLSPARSKRPRTWRHLTVAEERETLKNEDAVAFRIQIGKEQWLVYRSLNGSGNRTFMGENQICEFFLARTDGDTEADELLQIE